MVVYGGRTKRASSISDMMVLKESVTCSRNSLYCSAAIMKHSESSASLNRSPHTSVCDSSLGYPF